MEKLDIPQGTLDLMILTILSREPMHGYGISQKLAALSHDQFHVNPGSLFPSLYRLEEDGKLKAEWRGAASSREGQQDLPTRVCRRATKSPHEGGKDDVVVRPRELEVARPCRSSTR